MMFGRRDEDLQYENEALRRECNRLHAQDREEREYQYQKWQDEQDRRERERQESLLWPDNWHEAFRNNAIRLRTEAEEEAADNAEFEATGCPQHISHFFAEMVKMNKHAHAIYAEEEAVAQAQIDEIQRGMRDRVVARLREEFGDTVGIDEIIGPLEDDDPQALVAW